jgi:hypothetical protein
MKTDDQFFKDRLAMCESDGWKDLMEELQDAYEDALDVDRIQSIENLWFAKGQLAALRVVLTMEDVAKFTMEQSSSHH